MFSVPAALPRRPRLRALFPEAWARRRRRRRTVAIVLLLATGVGAALVAGRGGTRQDTVVAPRALAPLALAKAPFVGVACPAAPNSIACDRVGIAAFLAQRPAQLVATTGGRSTSLRDMHIRCRATAPRCPRMYLGYLQPAGLLHGALRVTPDAGRYRWYGRHPVVVTLRLRATYRGGRVEVTTRRVQLNAGFG